MSKLVGLACAAILLVGAKSQGGGFSRYKAVEAYEIRPGILMMPRYSANGEVCEIGLERLHYSPDKISLDSSLSRKEIDEIFDELVPANERGPGSKDSLGGLITRGGYVTTTNMDFENVSIQVFGEDLPASQKGGIVQDDMVATARWKNRRCQ